MTLNNPFVRRFLPNIGEELAEDLPFVGYINPLIRTAGFTLIELIVALAVVAVLATIAVPSMQKIIQRNRIATQTNSLISDIQLARSEAIRRGGSIVICTSNTGNSCTGTGWGSGRLTYYDAPPNDFVFTPGTDELIRYSDGPPTGLVNVQSFTFPDPLIFSAQGVPISSTGTRLVASNAAPLNVVLCSGGVSVPGTTVDIHTNGNAQSGDTPTTCP